MVSLRVQQRLWLTCVTGALVGAGAFIVGNTLLIGEQASDPANAPEQQPFCDDRGCSGWLNKLLDVHNISELTLFWVNALNNDGTEVDLSDLVEQLQPRKIFALGRTAEKLCKKHQLQHEYVSHPQHWKRFHSKKVYPLIEKLRGI